MAGRARALRVMSILLLVVGILITGAGVVAIGFGIPNNEFGLGNTLIMSGTTAFTGGLILIALAAAVSQLARIAEALRVRPVPRPIRPVDAAEPISAELARAAPKSPVPVQATADVFARDLRPVDPRLVEPRATEPRGAEPRVAEPRVADPRVAEPRVADPRVAEPRATEPRVAEPRAAEPRVAEPRAAEPRVAEPRVAETRPTVDATVEVSASAIERLRSSLSRPDKKSDVDADVDEVPLSPRAAGPRAVPSEAAPEGTTRSVGAAAVETLKKPRLDFLFRSKPSGAQAEAFDALWPKRQARDAHDQPQIGPSGYEMVPRAEEGPGAPGLSLPQEPRAAEILKSGVVDGMAYTLYADGSIEAQLPQGTVRFGSIAELRAHIENNS
jgi:hypothetical protein